jgi:glucosamine 6-phosphate synthetase-like amidotransferase/phosphosugar isomerase protein
MSAGPANLSSRGSSESKEVKSLRMCGIAGYSLSSRSGVNRTLAAQSLLAGIAERGADAVGYAYRADSGAATVRKQRSGASQLLDRISVPAATTQCLLHVRDYTKGHPSIEANNHPIRHGAVVGIHNGIIVNDDELFAAHGIERAAPEMTVDSEIIFALAERSRGRTGQALEELRGAMATAWIDEGRPELVLARGVARPLWIGRGSDGLFFASTKGALELVERYLRLRLRKRELGIGTLLGVVDGEIVAEECFRPDVAFDEGVKLPAVRAPREAETCLRRLAALAAA